MIRLFILLLGTRSDIYTISAWKQILKSIAFFLNTPPRRKTSTLIKITSSFIFPHYKSKKRKKNFKTIKIFPFFPFPWVSSFQNSNLQYPNGIRIIHLNKFCTFECFISFNFTRSFSSINFLFFFLYPLSHFTEEKKPIENYLIPWSTRIFNYLSGKKSKRTIIEIITVF